MNIAFIGLGAMGGGMARSLIRKGHRLAVFDVAAPARSAFASLDCRVASSPADAASDAGLVITMLPTSAHTRDVLFGVQGACDTLQRDAIVMEMSTGSPAQTLAIAKDLAARGIRMVDAPVNRTPPEAETGTLLAVVGGAREDVEAVTPALNTLADTIHHVGPLGSGIRMKLANNYMSMINLLLTAEGLMLAERAGIDRRVAADIMGADGNGASNGQLTTIYQRKVLAGDLTPDFRLSMCLKDITLALELGSELGLPLGLGAVARNVFGLARSWGREDQDCTAILPMLHEIANSKDVTF